MQSTSWLHLSELPGKPENDTRLSSRYMLRCLRRRRIAEQREVEPILVRSTLTLATPTRPAERHILISLHV